MTRGWYIVHDEIHDPSTLLYLIHIGNRDSSNSMSFDLVGIKKMCWFRYTLLNTVVLRNCSPGLNGRMVFVGFLSVLYTLVPEVLWPVVFHFPPLGSLFPSLLCSGLLRSRRYQWRTPVKDPTLHPSPFTLPRVVWGTHLLYVVSHTPLVSPTQESCVLTYFPLRYFNTYQEFINSLLPNHEPTSSVPLLLDGL